MFELLEKAFMMGIGAASLTAKKAEEFVKKAVEDKQVTESEGNQLLNTLLEEGKKANETLTAKIEEVMKSRGESLLPYWKKIQELEARVAVLEAELAEKKTE
ncbi:MAG: hypothetical protein K5787_07560 [Lentisphaeria bacterium]|nr:hypothetical protein [Victivallales bacterium]MCR4573609.1 hypothetical protein [Lentisphaeria bacterium]